MVGIPVKRIKVPLIISCQFHHYKTIGTKRICSSFILQRTNLQSRIKQADVATQHITFPFLLISSNAKPYVVIHFLMPTSTCFRESWPHIYPWKEDMRWSKQIITYALAENRFGQGLITNIVNERHLDVCWQTSR